jgi:predicted aspartyl protease
VLQSPSKPGEIAFVVQSGAHALFSGGIVLDVALGLDAITAQTTPTPVQPVVAKALIDTGCTITSVTEALAKQLGLVQRGVAQTLTAKGPAKSAVYAASITFPGSRLRPFPIMRIQEVDLRGQPFGVLIGRDILRGWVIHYNGVAGTITISD